jgi:LuxR family maltose regulon positive regulatory protein
MTSTPSPSRPSGRDSGRRAHLAIPPAKLEPPQLRHRVVRRERLLERLSAAVAGCRVTLVAGPPGAGKTTLLASWTSAGSVPGRPAWVSLDRHDDSPARFWSTVVAALAGVGALPDARLVDAIASPAFPALLGELPASLAAALADDAPVVLVLDDFHEISDARLLDGMATIVRLAPPPFRLVLATRRDPDLPLPRLRLSGQLGEVRADALAFTADETRKLLAGRGRPLGDREVALLLERTEGWAGALALAAMTIGGDDPAPAISRFAGDDRAVADYLASEVLDSLPEETRDFLVATSVVDRICGGLADAITGEDTGAATLEDLARANCFVLASGDGDAWFRYHVLFREFLRSRLARLPEHDRRELHARAATWLAWNDHPVEAMPHAVAAEEWSFAGNLVADHWVDAHLTGHSAVLRPLLKMLPPQLAEQDPAVAVAFAALHLEAGDTTAADRAMALAHGGLDDAELDGADGQLLAVVALLRARCRGSAAEAIEVALGGLGAAESAPPEQRALVLSLLGAAELWSGALDDAGAHLRSALAIARQVGNDYLVLGALGHLALVELLEGRLQLAARLAGEAVEAAELAGFSDVPQASAALLATGWAGLYACDPEADAVLERAAAAARGSGDDPLRLAIAAVRALGALAQDGGARHGLSLLHAETAELGDWDAPVLVDALLRTSEIRLLLAAGSEAEALGRIGRVPAATAAVLRARAALTHADPAPALEALAPWLDDDASTPALRIEAHVLAAVARHRRLDYAGATVSLEAALALAGSDRWPWVFLQAGPSLRDLLTRQVRAGTAHRGLVEDLRVRLERSASAAPTGGVKPLLEPLSAREKTILSYMETMLSTEEIASELFLSTNTVKTHAKSIYRKLGVSRRRQAVLRGRALELL